MPEKPKSKSPLQRTADIGHKAVDFVRRAGEAAAPIAKRLATDVGPTALGFPVDLFASPFMGADDETPSAAPGPVAPTPPAAAPAPLPIASDDFAGPPTASVKTKPIVPRSHPLGSDTWEGIQSRAYRPDVVDWTGLSTRESHEPELVSRDPDGLGVSVKYGPELNLSRAQIEADLGTRNAIEQRYAGEIAGIQNRYRDPQDDNLRAIERTAAFESFMPRDEQQPLFGEGGAFKRDPSGVIRTTTPPPRTRAIDAPLELYGGQRAIDRADLEQRQADFEAVTSARQAAYEAARQRILAQPGLSPQQQQEQIDALTAKHETAMAQLPIQFGFKEKGTSEAFRQPTALRVPG